MESSSDESEDGDEEAERDEREENKGIMSPARVTHVGSTQGS